MTVTSYLELFTTLLGWLQFETLWQVLSDTGMVFLPFLFILIEGFLQAPSPAAALRDTEIKVALTLTAVVLAGQPAIELDPTIVEYRPLCQEETYTLGNTGTTYDEAFFVPQTTVSVPIWWYGTLAVASGTTYAAVLGLDCTTDFRKLAIQLDKERVTDPPLLNEVAQFLKDCFVPARSTFYREQPEVKAMIDKYGQEDPETFLSKVYRDTPGYYDRRRASLPVKGWPYDPNRDTEPGMGPDSDGRPVCKPWLEDPTRGLRQRLIAQMGPELEKDVRQRYADWAVMLGFRNLDQERAIDAVLNGLVVNAVAAAPAGKAFATYTDAKGLKVKVSPLPFIPGPEINLTGLAAHVGTLWENLSFAPMMYAVRTGAPIVQALILMGIYLLLPFGLVFSRYSWTFIFLATLAILTLYFWTYFWHIAIWMENRLFMMLFPDGNALFATVKSLLADPNYYLKLMLLNMAVVLMFIGLPLLFSMVMAWAGFRMGGVIASVFEQSRQQFARSGRAAADQAKGAGVSMAMRSRKSG